MTTKLGIVGERESRQPRAVRGQSAEETAQRATNLLDAVELVDSFNLSDAARERATSTIELDVEDDDILEIEVEGGFTIWTSAARYQEDLALIKPGAIVDGVVRIDTLPRTSVSERGVKEWVQRGLRVLRVKTDAVTEALRDPSKWPDDFISQFGIRLTSKLTAYLTTKLLMRLIEDRRDPPPGLYSWRVATEKPAEPGQYRQRAEFKEFDPEKPILVFIHGTASSTIGSFGAFLTDEARPHWRRLDDIFGEHIYAFDHRTLSESPIENALQLIAALPRHARVNLVSHSRGGMVGDLLCLKAVQSHAISRFTRNEDDLHEADLHDRACLEKLAAAIAEKQLRIERFVRCASPARGTLLAGENIDTFLSVLTNLIGLIPGVGGNPLYEVIKRTTLEIAKNRTKPELVPGIEAMMPTSPLVGFLNAVDEEAGGSLGVVAGDIEGGGWLKRLGVFLTDHVIYSARDNDLVVNTDSMFYGARRREAYYVFDQGADVNHFNYFRNARTRASLIDWLSAKSGDVPKGFNPIGESELEPVPMLRSLQSRAGAAQPIVFVLPGIMGSHLAVRGSRVWLDYPALLGGGFGDLANLDDVDIRPDSLIGDYYRRLCEYLANSHEVIPFAYDWRKSTSDAAHAFAAEIEKALARTKEPVRILAHSMGGLVVTSMMAERADLWDRLCERDGARFVMLGTPNRGSYSIVEALLGTATTVQQLALLDPHHRTSEITAIIARFPGLLELLPAQDGWFQTSSWEGYTKSVRTAAVPAEMLLAKAKQAAQSRATEAPLKHVERVLFVAGASNRTVTSVEFVNKRIVLNATTEGDGRVTYESGRLPGVATWYVEAEHGDLSSHEPAFPAFVDLLERGATNRLSNVPPSRARGGQAAYRTLPTQVLYPTPIALTAGLMGQRRAKLYAGRAKRGFRVSVVHGDLRYARFPVIVGHYQGDTIIYAEAEVDRMLDGALSRRYALGLYPGPLGSISIVLRKPSTIQQILGLPAGAIVIGLGTMGDLSTAEVANLIRSAALQYVLQLDDRHEEPSEGAAGSKSVGLSILLIGGNSSTRISTGDSVGAILRGIGQANRELETISQDVGRVSEIEIVELYADVAIEAAHAVNRLATLVGAELEMEIEALPLLKRGREGRTRLRSTAASDRWRRWEISLAETSTNCVKQGLPVVLANHLKKSILEAATPSAELIGALADLALEPTDTEASTYREIRFLTMSDRARAEIVAQQRQPELIERLIKESIAQTTFRPDESRMLFELLMPFELKDGLAQLDNVVFVVDSETATYPWELMSPGAEPFCVAKGLIRQLQTMSYRPQIGARSAQLAYVVGDPLVSPPFQQLPGAHEEAKAVAGMLQGRFEVNYTDAQLSSLQVLAGLYEKPYRILHLAGHGHYADPSSTKKTALSGMVLDNGIYLTAVEIAQMRQVPELVFLNCCHIGQTGPETPARQSKVAFNRLAASVSRELIQMGVRAIVAAGWAVRDDAALHFAKAFYDAMLDGDTFGRALKSARWSTWWHFRDCNTWGAYQAYGDPDYKLEPAAPRPTRDNVRYVDAAEFIQAVADLARGARSPSVSTRTQASATERLDALVRSCPSEWLGLADVLIAIGYGYGDLGDFRAANGYLAAAIEGEGPENKATLQSVERLSNFQVRLAEDGSRRAKDEKERQFARDEAARAVERLSGILALAQTGERYSLLGSAYKRLAVLQSDRVEARRCLELAADNYKCAHDRAVARKSLDPYPLLNWLTLSAVLGRVVPDAETLLQRGETAARERFAQTRDFWQAAAIPDAALARALARKEVDAAILAASYLETFKQAKPSPREVDSVAKQIEIVSDLLEKLQFGKTVETTAQELRAVAAAISGGGKTAGFAGPTGEMVTVPEERATAPKPKPNKSRESAKRRPEPKRKPKRRSK